MKQKGALYWLLSGPSTSTSVSESNTENRLWFQVTSLQELFENEANFSSQYCR